MNPSSANHAAYPFGAVYLLEPEYTWTGIERDMRLMRDHGFNTLTLWPAANSWLATRPDEYVFDDTLRYLDLARSLGLRVIVQLIGQNQSQEFAPDCLMRPDMVLSDPGAGAAAGGLKGWNNCFWANLNHPDVDILVKRYLETCVAALRHHPAVCGWDIFNEAHFRSDDPWTVARYRDWLRQRYDNKIETLNRRWFRRYRDFSEVNPADRDAPYSVWSSMLPVIDYEHFRSQTLTDICARWAAWTRAADPDRQADGSPVRPVIIDGTSGQLLEQSLSGRNNDEFSTARVPDCDIFGGTFYPKSWGRDLGDRPWELMHYYGMSRAAAVAAGKPYYVNELQTHTQAVLTPGSEMSPSLLALCIWAAIAAGAEAMQLWRWRPFLRGYQASGRGLTRLDGTPGPRAAAVAALVRTLRENEAAITASRPVPADVKILVGYRARVVHDVCLKGTSGHQSGSLRGWHRVFTALGFAVENASLECLSEADLATPVMVLPAAIALTDDQAAWLARYVAAGGTLIAEARLAILDDNGVVRSEGSPGRVLSEVFGVIERDVGPAGEFTWGGHRLPAPFLTQQLELLPSAGARILAREAATGWPMVTENRHGQGRAVYFASVQGTAWRENLCAYAQQFFAGLFPADHPHRVEKPEHVLIRWHENPATGDTLAYVMNFDTGEAEVRFASGRTLRMPPQGTRLVTAGIWPTLPLDEAARSPAFT
ncbi:beta-galactosidase [Opitutaceae bacterium TAV1]|nr:beta-galactosidase [Opitutaceae bacterium TAV1]